MIFGYFYTCTVHLLLFCTITTNVQLYVNKCPTRCKYTQFILSVNCSTCFGWSLHPSSGSQITVSTASGTSQLLLPPVGILHDSDRWRRTYLPFQFCWRLLAWSGWNAYRMYKVLRYSWWWTVNMSETYSVFYEINLRNIASRLLSL